MCVSFFEMFRKVHSLTDPRIYILHLHFVNYRYFKLVPPICREKPKIENVPETSYLSFLFKFFKYGFLYGFSADAVVPADFGFFKNLESVELERKFLHGPHKYVAVQMRLRSNLKYSMHSITT
jgi:hypothetical protein